MNKCINVTPEIERAFNKTRDSFRMTGVTPVCSTICAIVL